MSDVTTLHEKQLENINSPVYQEQKSDKAQEKGAASEPTPLPSLNDILQASNLNELIDQIYLELCDDLIFNMLLQVHRASKLGYLFYLQPENTNNSKYQVFEQNDVIGVFSHLNTEPVSGKQQGMYLKIIF